MNVDLNQKEVNIIAESLLARMDGYQAEGIDDQLEASRDEVEELLLKLQTAGGGSNRYDRHQSQLGQTGVTVRLKSIPQGRCADDRPIEEPGPELAPESLHRAWREDALPVHFRHTSLLALAGN